MEDNKLFFDIKFEKSINRNVICIANEEDSKNGKITLLYSWDQSELLDKLEEEGFTEWDVGIHLIPLECPMSKDKIIQFIKSLGFEYKPNFIKSI